MASHYLKVLRGFPDALPHLIEALAEPLLVMGKRRRVVLALVARLSGEDFGDDVDAWREWWEKRGARAD